MFKIMNIMILLVFGFTSTTLFADYVHNRYHARAHHKVHKDYRVHRNHPVTWNNGVRRGRVGHPGPRGPGNVGNVHR